jgi:hypothetical protein
VERVKDLQGEFDGTEVLLEPSSERVDQHKAFSSTKGHLAIRRFEKTMDEDHQPESALRKRAPGLFHQIAVL